MKIVVAESKWTGHHLFFAREIAEMLADGEHEVVFALPDADAELPKRMIELALEGIDGRIELRRSLRGPSSGFSRVSDTAGEIEVDALRSILPDLRPDTLVLPSADAIAYHLGRRPDGLVDAESTRLIMHQPYLGYRGRGWKFAAKRQTMRRRVRRLRGSIAALDHRIAESLAGIRPVTLIPGPPAISRPKTREEARKAFDLPMHRRIFLAAGEHSRRKGTDRLLSLWPADSDATLFVVGQCSEEVRQVLRTRKGDVEADRIRVLDGVIDNQTYADAFRAADVVTVCYPSHFGASGVLNAAVCFQRPVIGSDYGCIGDSIRRFGLGTALDCGDPATLAAALADATERPPTLDRERAEGLIAFHTHDNLKRVVRTWTLGPSDEHPSPLPFPD